MNLDCWLRALLFFAKAANIRLEGQAYFMTEVKGSVLVELIF
jgi:hypothetical protein